jgi:hypothetical protein
MLIPVLLTSQHPGNVIRLVEIPNADILEPNFLDLVVKYGQNSRNPMELGNVTMGDVIMLHNGDNILILASRYEKLTESQFHIYKNIPTVEGRITLTARLERTLNNLKKEASR